MNSKRTPRIIVIIIGSIILIVGIVLLAIRYPLSSNKDFLDILSSLGSAISAIGIFFVIYELFLKEKELSEEKSPDLEIGDPTITFSTETALPSGTIKCLCEASADQLPPKEELYETNDDYHTLWNMAQRTKQQDKSIYVMFEVRNHQENSKGTARNFAVKLGITYYRNEAKDIGYSLATWVPAEGREIHNQTKLFYVRCGPVTDPNYTYIMATIIKYKCNNNDGDNFEKNISKNSGRKSLLQAIPKLSTRASL